MSDVRQSPAADDSARGLHALTAALGWVLLSTASLMVGAVTLLTSYSLARQANPQTHAAWLWLLAGVLVGLVSLTPFRFLQFFSSRVLGSENPPAAIFFLGFVAVTLLCLQFSVRLSRMTEQIKNLGQKIGILEAQLRQAQKMEALGARRDGAASVRFYHSLR